MGKLHSFTFLTLNGFYKGEGEDISWHIHSNAAGKFANEASQSFNILLFGRKTYELMAAFWPTPEAAAAYPVVAAKMNQASKYVVSSSLQSADWSHTQVIKENVVDAIRNLKETEERDITILGSGNLVTQLTEAGLIDSYLLMIDPLVIGKGTPLFDGIKNQLDLSLTASRIFEEEGVLVLTYEPRQPGDQEKNSLRG